MVLLKLAELRNLVKKLQDQIFTKWNAQGADVRIWQNLIKKVEAFFSYYITMPR